MTVIALAGLLFQLTAATRTALPILAFPERGLDDSSAYQGYQTRLYRDHAGNAVQIYLDRREGRVVHVWANSENQSVGLSARDERGRPAGFDWGDSASEVSDSVGTRTLTHQLVATNPVVHLGWFLLGSMRVERDFQYWGRHRAPFTAPAFTLTESRQLIAALTRLSPATRQRHLSLLNAADLPAMRARLRPTITISRSDTTWVARISQSSLDGRDTTRLELSTDPRRVAARLVGREIVMRARSGRAIPVTVRIGTTSEPLTPLSREEIFTPEFLAFLERARNTDSAGARSRWLERQVRSVELLSSREKLMAGLPTYATYFGRDMLVSALMMRGIWRDEMSEFVIASVLRKLSSTGEVSHEEALGGQAEREASAQYASLVSAHFREAQAGRRSAADSLLTRAADVLRTLRQVREAYHMIDDEVQLPILVARWLGDADVPDERKRDFLRDSSNGGGSRLERLVRELGVVIRAAGPYGADPVASNLISFRAREGGGWASASWRDSNAGYAGGRYAMDVNTIWVPHAVAAIQEILHVIRALGFSVDSLGGRMADLAPDAPLGRWARDSVAMRAAISAWRGSARHFVVRLSPSEVRARVTARVGAMRAPERTYWMEKLNTLDAARDSLSFLAVALDSARRPIAVANTDRATQLFLGELSANPGGDTVTMGDVSNDVKMFVLPYPVGLYIDQLGPVAANDAFATPAVWRAFERDRYHGPRVVWGREVNLFLLGAANRIAASDADPSAAPLVAALREAIAKVRAAVEASGFHAELWSYAIHDGRLMPMRYGSGGDVQLWSTTTLAVQYALSRLHP